MELGCFSRDGYFFPLRATTEQRAGELLDRYWEFRRTVDAIPSLTPMHAAWKPHLLVTWLDELVRAPPVLDAASQVLGTDILVWSVDLFVKPGRESSDERLPGSQRFAWHQDSLYFGLAPLSGVVRTWIALTPTCPENGTMRYLPGSHLAGTYRHVDHGNENSEGERVDMPIDESQAVSVNLGPGEFSIHDVSLVHDSGRNSTAAARVCVAVTYVSASVEVTGSKDTALLVAGNDPGTFDLESSPDADFDPAAVDHYLTRMHQRYKRLEELRRNRSNR